jgi:hypothetical protein
MTALEKKLIVDAKKLLIGDASDCKQSAWQNVAESVSSVRLVDAVHHLTLVQVCQQFRALEKHTLGERDQVLHELYARGFARSWVCFKSICLLCNRLKA